MVTQATTGYLNQLATFVTRHRFGACVFLLAATIVSSLHGCYYVQAVRGHMAVMHSRRPVSEVLADPAVSGSLKERLALVEEARQFAVDELQLPDNDSYRSYADLGRDYVVWNVFAAPEFSLEPRRWCFPVAGCVAYRGYFSHAAANEEAEALQDDGYDVAVGGVAAYSTLGRFADPILNTMMHWNDAYLIATIFHELAHQKLYVRDDTQFNESFASAVAEIGMQRWLTARGADVALQGWHRDKARQSLLLEVIEARRNELARLYDSALSPAEKRRRKKSVFEGLSDDVATLLETSPAETAAGFVPPVNNAGLVSFGLYEGWASAFENLYDECSQRLDCFYRRSGELAALPAGERSRRLGLLDDR